MLSVAGEDRRRRRPDRPRRQARDRIQIGHDLGALERVQERQHLPVVARVAEVVAGRARGIVAPGRLDQRQQLAGVLELLVQELLGRLGVGAAQQRIPAVYAATVWRSSSSSAVEDLEVGLLDRRADLLDGLAARRAARAAAGEPERPDADERRPGAAQQCPARAAVRSSLTTRRWSPGSRSPRRGACRSRTRGTSSRRRRR